MYGLKKYYESVTRKVNAGNFNKPGCVNADMAKFELFKPEEFSKPEDVKFKFVETRLSNRLKRRRPLH